MKMITEKLVNDCIAYDKSEYDESKTYEQEKSELETLEKTGCLVENILHCSSCPKFGKECPLK